MSDPEHTTTHTFVTPIGDSHGTRTPMTVTDGKPAPWSAPVPPADADARLVADAETADTEHVLSVRYATPGGVGVLYLGDVPVARLATKVDAGYTETVTYLTVVPISFTNPLVGGLPLETRSVGRTNAHVQAPWQVDAATVTADPTTLL